MKIFEEALTKLISLEGTNQEVLNKCWDDYIDNETEVELIALWFKITETLLAIGISNKDLQHRIIILDHIMSKRDSK